MLRAVDVLVAAAMDQLDQCEVTDSRLRTAIDACAADQNEERALKKFGGMMTELNADENMQMDRVRISKIFDDAVDALPAAAGGASLREYRFHQLPHSRIAVIS